MINLIGAYIITLLLLALIKERRAVASNLLVLERIPLAGRIVLSFLLFAFALRQGNFITPSRLSILDVLFIVLDGFSLWVHEAGHAYCMFFGKFVNSLGGTLAELVFPTIIIFVAHLVDRPVLSSLGVYWLGFNLIGISIYLGDARTRDLPLLGAGEHDWYYLLGVLNLLESDQHISAAVMSIGWMVVIAALLMLVFRFSTKAKLAISSH